MNLLRLYPKKTLSFPIFFLLCINLISCATTEAKVQATVVDPKSIENLFQSKDDGGAWKKFVDSIDELDKERRIKEGLQPRDKISALFSVEQSTGIFKQICKGGKPVKGVRHQVTYIVPKAPPGLALDKAGKHIEKNQKLMRTYISHFYDLMMYGDENYLDRYVGYDIQNGPGTDPRGLPVFLAPHDQKSNVLGLSGNLRSLTVNWQGIAAHENSLYFPQSNSPVVLMSGVAPNKKVLMTSVNQEKFFSRQQINVQGGTKEIRRPPLDLYEFVPAELTAIGEHYALVVSDDEYESWKELAYQRTLGNLAGSVPPISPSTPKPASELLERREDIMRAYLVANTAIKESVGSDGQTFEFQLELNTEPLCRAAKPVKSLQSS